MKGGEFMNKKTLLAIAGIAILGSAVLGSSGAFAQTTTESQNPVNSLVQKLATKFNLNQNEVQAVFDEAHLERNAQRKTQVESQLAQWVSEGKITEAQKQLILQKTQELQAEHESNRGNLTREQHSAQKAAKHAELQSWAEQNGIDTQYLMLISGKGFGKHSMPNSQFGSTTTQTPGPSVTQ